MSSIEELLGITKVAEKKETKSKKMAFSLLFFSDVRKDISDIEKYAFMKDITLFADREGFEAIYIPERHFYEFGSIYANSAVVAAYLISQTKRIRFRTAGISLPLHHPAEIVEWWAMNDILSGGRVDLGFGSGWNKPDFILAPDNYNDRRKICSDRISIVQKLWRGETVSFLGPDGESIPIQVFPRPLQKELNIWLLVAQSDEAFTHAGEKGYNVFTMLYGNNLEVMSKKVALYRKARKEAGHDEGTVTLMLHTLIYKNYDEVQKRVEKPFKEYIKSALQAHANAAENQEFTEDEKSKMLEYAYQRYFKTAGLFGTLEDATRIVDEAIEIGINEIACLVDFGVDYNFVIKSMPYLQELVSIYHKDGMS